MKYKVFLVSVVIACLLAGCSRSKDSVNGFLQYDSEDLASNSETENKLTQDDIAQDSDLQSEQLDITEQNEGRNNLDILDPMLSNTDGITEEHNETFDDLANQNANEGNDSTTESYEKEDEDEVVPTLTPEEEFESERPEAEYVPTKAPVATVTPAPTKAPSATVTPTPTKAPTPVPTKAPVAPTSAPSQSDAFSVSVRGETITIGDSKSSVVSKLGSPARTDETEFTYDFMVYNDNYKKFVMVAIENDKVVGWYTDATDFSFQGLTTSSGVSAINSTFGKSLSSKKTLSVTTGSTNIVFYMDTLGDSTIDGILVTTKASTDGVTSNVLTTWEKEVFDLTNSFRARNGLSALLWSKEAATAARLHSKDMADNNYFDHTGLDGSTPSTRMKAQGISFTMSGENIIGGYGNALYSSNGWMNSSGHRSNMLNSSYTYLGVGYVLGGSYGNYATQNFFRK